MFALLEGSGLPSILHIDVSKNKRLTTRQNVGAQQLGATLPKFDVFPRAEK